MEQNSTLGEQELDALRYVAENAPISAGQAARDYGAQRGLARTTVLTMLERLRRKGFLARRRLDGIYLYSPRVDREALLKRLVSEFVDRSLGGSLAPFVTYLADSGKLNAVEVDSLREMVTALEKREAGTR